MDDDAARARDRLLERLAFFLPLAAFVTVYFIDGTGFHPNGDGYYSWIFARSLAFDFDFEFRNDYALCGDPWGEGVDRGTGHPDNPFYAGPAFFWLVPLALLRALFSLALGAARAAAASCGGWMTALTILVGPLCGAVTSWLMYRSARFVVSPATAVFATLLFSFTSPLFPYSTSAAHYSHVYLTCAVAFATFVSIRIVSVGHQRYDGLLLGAAIAIATLCRLSAAAYVVVPCAALASHIRNGDRHAIRTGLGACLGAGVGIAMTALLYQYLYGRSFAVPQGPDFVHFGHAHPWLLLFGVQGGFFFWMPAAWLAVPGVVFGLRRPSMRFVTLGFFLAAVVEVFVSSSPLDWYARWTLGARRLLPLLPFVVLWAALSLERVAEHARRRPKLARPVATLCILLVLVNNIPGSTTIRGDAALSQRELYGAWSPLRPLWWGLDRLGIDVALLPAELYFAQRYGLPTTSYRDVLKVRYERHHRTLAFTNDKLDLRSPEVAKLVSGGARWTTAGVTISDVEGHLAFTTEWPFATHARLLVRANEPSELKIATTSSASPLAQLGKASLERSNLPEWIELPLGPKAFDSGINQWHFKAHGGRITILEIVLEDRTPRVPYG